MTSDRPYLDHTHAAHITTAIARLASKDFQDKADMAVTIAENASRHLAAIWQILEVTGHDLATYSEFMSKDQKFLFEEAGGDIKKLLQLISRDGIKYKHLAAVLKNTTAAGETLIYKYGIPDDIVCIAVRDLMNFYEQTCKTTIPFAKNLPDENGQYPGKIGDQQPATIFIYECLNLINPRIALSSAVTLINKELESRKKGESRRKRIGSPSAQAPARDK